MLCLTDNDITFKLAYMDLIEESLIALGVAKSEVYVLPDLKYRFFIAKRWARAVEKFGESVALRIKDFLSQVCEIDKRQTA